MRARARQGWAAQRRQAGGNVGLPRAAQQADGGGAGGGEHAGKRADAYLGAVLIEGDVAHPVGAVLDVPVAAQQVQQALGRGLLRP